MNVKIIEQPFEWNRLVTQAHFYDLYHLYTYNKIQTVGRPVLFCVADDQHNFIALPLLIREINDSSYFDCTSVYGYPGPISNLPYESIPIDLIYGFQDKLMEYFKNAKIVSAFSRLNPLVNQGVCFSSIGDVVEQGKTVSIDLSLTPEEQWSGYRKSYKGDINRLSKMGYIVKKAVSEAEIEEFASIYHETMQRVGANQKYFFDADYFKELIYAIDVQCTLLVGFVNRKMACGALFISTNDVMQYHIAATRTEFLSNAPMKLVVDTARRIAVAESLKHFHMGGGSTGSTEDPLFHFKKGFSDIILPFKVWKCVVDRPAYDELVLQYFGEPDHTENYFPLYRKKAQAFVI